MDIEAFDNLVSALPGVHRRTERGLWRWERHGRLVARQLDDTSVVVRAAFDVRDQLVRQWPHVFTVPARFAKHMMVVADLAAGDDDAVEEAVVSAWVLQGS